MSGSFDSWLVLLSIVVACLASYTALDLAARVAATSGRRAAAFWLAGGALSMGIGIWSMHFIGMLAFRLPIAMSYAVPATLLSLLIAVVVSGYALHTASRGALGVRRLLAAGALMGLGIAAMHYTGMAAMEMQPPITYQPLLVAASLAIAIGASIVALWIAFRLRAETMLSATWRRLGAALVMGSAIAGMHYTGMAAAIFAPDSICTVPPQHIDNVWLAATIGAFAVTLFVITLLISIFDERMMERSALAAEALRESEEKYRTLWETTSDAALMIDGAGRIEFANSAMKTVFGYAPEEVLGRNVSMLLPERLRASRESEVTNHLATGARVEIWRAGETLVLHRDGREVPVEFSFNRVDLRGRARFGGFVRDITERKRFEAMQAGQKRVLELIASGVGLMPALEAITRLCEEQFPETLSSIVLVDESGTKLGRSAAPSLPDEYNEAIEGLVIGPAVGSCGTAAWRREPVVVADIATDPLWADYRQLALPHGLAACWSHPIVSSQGTLFGALAMYSRVAREPTARELEAIRAAAPLAGIAIERARAEEQMRQTNERFNLVAKATNDAVWDWDLLGGTFWWSEGYQSLFGYEPKDTPPGVESWSDHLHPQERERVMSGIHAAIDSGEQTWFDEYRFQRRNGSYADIFDRGFVVRDAGGRAVRMIGAMMDISERKRAEEQLARMAQFDALTGLPNRNLFRDRLAQAIARAHREDWITALAFVDLDRFKEINDTLGHAAGDAVLKSVGERLRAHLREGDTVARLGGDEFTVILEDVGSRAQVEIVARKMLSAFEHPLRIEGKDLFTNISIGIAVYPEHGLSAESLLQHADTAMYHIKGEGGGNLQFYVPTMGHEASERIGIEGSLRQALARREFLLYYQPIVDLATGAIGGVEALLRWQHPQWGLTAPGRFIGIAESSGLIVPIGEWVLREACAQVMAWRRAGLPAMQVSVNISARQFRKTDLVEVVAGVLSGSGLEGAQLKLEITESLLMEKPVASGRLLERLKAMGVSLALDDFGTGYSSLSYLKHFPLDVIKIDQSFVREVSSDSDDAAIVKAMIGLAHSLQLSLTAEGVETAEQLAFLRTHGCDSAQGYYFSRPLPAADCEALLRSGAPLGAGGAPRLRSASA